MDSFNKNFLISQIQYLDGKITLSWGGKLYDLNKIVGEDNH